MPLNWCACVRLGCSIARFINSNDFFSLMFLLTPQYSQHQIFFRSNSHKNALIYFIVSVATEKKNRLNSCFQSNVIDLNENRIFNISFCVNKPTKINSPQAHHIHIYLLNIHNYAITGHIIFRFLIFSDFLFYGSFMRIHLYMMLMVMCGAPR